MTSSSYSFQPRTLSSTRHSWTVKDRGRGEDFHQLFAVVGDAAAGAAEGEAGADEDGKTELGGEIEAVAEVVDQRGFLRLRDRCGAWRL